MKKKSKTEITIETDRKFFIRARKSIALVWCAECRETSRMVPPEEIVALSGISARAIYRAVEAGDAHFLETIEGLLLVCLKSLSVEEENPFQRAVRVDPPSRAPLLEVVGQRNGERVQERPFFAEQRPASGVETEYKACPPAHKRDWVLTADALEGLLECLDADRERAGRKYENVRRKLTKYFECRGCLSPEEMTDETINRVARRISEGKDIHASDPANYFYGVARNVLREYWGAPERKLAPIEESQPDSLPYEDTLKLEDLGYERRLMEKRFECLEESIKELSDADRELIINYYQGEKGEKIKNRKELARGLGLPPNALRIKIHRIRERLERLVSDRLNRSLMHEMPLIPGIDN